MDAPRLAGRLVTLEPLGPHHVDALTAAATRDRSSFGFTRVPRSGAEMEAYVDGLLCQRDRGLAFPYAQVITGDGEVVGCTRYLEPEPRSRGTGLREIDVGGTWLATGAQRTGVNTGAKLLLFTHAFEVWGVDMVRLATDARNSRSREAIARLGATFDGLVDGHREAAGDAVEEGVPRTSATFSVSATAWPAVKRALGRRLDRGGGGHPGGGI